MSDTRLTRFRPKLTFFLVTQVICWLALFGCSQPTASPKVDQNSLSDKQLTSEPLASPKLPDQAPLKTSATTKKTALKSIQETPVKNPTAAPQAANQNGATASATPDAKMQIPTIQSQIDSQPVPPANQGKLDMPKESAPIRPEPESVTQAALTDPSPAKAQLEPVAPSSPMAVASAATTAASIPTPAIAKSESPQPNKSAVKADEKRLDTKLISGQMRIDFASRNAEAPGGIDRYSTSLTVAEKFKISGTISREPRVESKLLKVEKSPLQMRYALSFSHPGKDTPIAKLLGAFPIREDGVYELASGNDRLRIEGDGLAKSEFAGTVVGKKQSASDSIADKIKSYSRLIGGRKITHTTKKIDPLGFKQLVLAPGPTALDPSSLVNGNLDYDYDTGNWYAENLEFAYRGKDGRKVKDVISGSIRWQEHPQRKLNGKGSYQFNLRYNELQTNQNIGEAAAFETADDEEAFFEVDTEIPGIYGEISYQDKFLPISSEEPVVGSSVVTYRLEARGLTDLQVLNFIKLWFIVVGPMNDE